MAHYHAFGEATDLGKKPGTKLRGPANGCCRCEAHIADDMKEARRRPTCDMECYMCERMRVLAVRLAK